ncbi:glycosyltransferase family 4 protein [Candidatus Saccharibacteria bacterium]|nr:glycosyltransferase family 4 protein [Candidatus Saccharibacteria bacterium]
MPRVVIDARESGTTTGRYVDKLIEHLHNLKPPLEIAVLTKSHRLEFMQGVAPSFEVIKCDWREFSFGEQYGFLWQLYGLRNDLVHFSMTQQPILYFGQSLTTVHDLTTARFRNPAKNWLVFSFKQAIYRSVIKLVARKSKQIITASQYVRQDLADFAKLDPAKIEVIYEAADKIEDKPVSVSQLKSGRYLLYVGRPLPHKNLKRLIEAFALLQNKRPGLKLVLAGKSDANYRRLEKFADQKAIKNIVFTGFIEDAKLRWLYEQAAAYVFPSLSEGFGLPGLEAMHYGLPVISSHASCLPEIYKDAALYFDPLSIEDMTDKIAKVLDNPALAKQLADKGHRVAKQYSWAKTAQQTLAIYEQVINGKS